MRWISVLAFLLLPHLGVCSDEWTRGDTYRQAAYSALTVVDWAQTREIARSKGRWKEGNVILGESPSLLGVDAYFVGMLGLNAAISYLLPREYRTPWQYVTIGVEASATAMNFGLGIKGSF